MGRIPEDELERIKRETDLVALVRVRGIELKPHGKDLLGLCPFHEDHAPSLVVTPGKNLWHCLGACNAGGTAIDWVMRAEGVSFREAVDILRGGSPAATRFAEPTPPPVDLQASDEALLRQVIDYYHATLKTSPEALAYLGKRGLGSPDALAAFTLGFANRTLGLRLPSTKRADGLKLRHRLTSLGILRATGHEHLNGCLVIPIFDEQGRVAEVYGRKIRDDLRDGTAYHVYLPGPHRGVFNLSALRSSKEIILCEALIDALTFWCAGFANVTSSYGVNGFTPDHLEAMKAYGTERVLIAYDRDAAGDAAAVELAKKLAAEGITCFRVRFPHGMDANDYACRVTPASQSLGVLLRAAEYMAGPLVQRPATAAAHSSVVREAAEAAPPEPLPSLAAAAEPVANPDPPPPAPDPPAPPPASPLPAAPPPDIPAEVNEQQVVIRLGDRTWRIRGLAKNLSLETLKVNVLVGLEGHSDRYHVDTLDLYAAKQRAAFLHQAATDLGIKEDIVKKDLGAVLLKLDALQELQIKSTFEPKQATVAVEEKDRLAALELLRDPHLLDRILADFERCGVVGETTNKLVGYLAAVSRKLDRPLAVMVQSSSAAGKSALMSAVLAFVPEEERVAYSAMTGQSLFYMAETNLEHKLLAIAEEEGAERASYALKQLQSEGELSIASTGKDPTTGRLVTHEYRVKGPAAIVMTTTAIDLDEELLNRCLVLTVDEDREQTRAIHRMQRERRTLEGIVARNERNAVLALHQNAQRLLCPLAVANRFARELTFLDDKTRTRRDHEKYLTLIEAIALLHQHQRPVLTAWSQGTAVPYIEVTLDDIEVANRLAHEVLGRTLDELPPQTRRFLLLLDAMAAEACTQQGIEREAYRFSRAEARRCTGWSLTQVRVHLDRLVEMEYALIHHGGRGSSFVYELLYAGQGQTGEPFLLGLLDVATLRQPPPYDPKVAGSEPGVADQNSQVAGSRPEMAGSKRAHGGAKTGEWRTGQSRHDADGNIVSPVLMADNAQNAHPGGLNPVTSYPHRGHTAETGHERLLPFGAAHEPDRRRA
jgi:DNA primase catalytic core